MFAYTTIKLSDYHIAQIEKLVGKYGFDSRADVVKAALNSFYTKYPETKILTTETPVEA